MVRKLLRIGAGPLSSAEVPREVRGPAGAVTPWAHTVRRPQQVTAAAVDNSSPFLTQDDPRTDSFQSFQKSRLCSTHGKFAKTVTIIQS